MQKPARPDGLDTNSRALRSPSISSDVMSNSAKSAASIVPHANPPPAYISQGEASKLMTGELDRTVVVTPAALTLVNDFLDQVLYTILSTSRSLSLAALKTAIPTVLKPRLGKAALRVAEDELREYMEDEEEAEIDANKGMMNSKHDFDTEIAWKLARLRCMVYTRLGDLEEEDEEEWLEREQLLDHANASAKMKQGDIELGPPSAIFLTSVIDYLGEQALGYAAQHAQRRHNMGKQAGENSPDTATLTPKTDEIIVDGKDMNHVGRDSPLSRLWRSWRRNTRESTSRPMSPDSMVSPVSAHSRTGSSTRPFPMLGRERKLSNAQIDSPSRIPLPQTSNDVDEIEVPGLASALSESEDDAPEIPNRSKKRPLSLEVMPGTFPGTPSALDELQGGKADVPELHRERPAYMRARSISSPTPAKGSVLNFGANARNIDERLGQTPTNNEEVNSIDVKPHSDVTAPQSDVVNQSYPDSTATESDDTIKPQESIIATQSDVSPEPQSENITAQSDAVASRRERLPSLDQDSSNKRAGMVGGAIAAAAGVLGAGAAAAASKRNENEEVPEKDSGTYKRSLSPTKVQKKTVAEQMLGSASTVPPPKDATTGASITNFSDFDSMHIPMQMPPESPPVTASHAVPSNVSEMIASRENQHSRQTSEGQSMILPRKPVADRAIIIKDLPNAVRVSSPKAGRSDVATANREAFKHMTSDDIVTTTVLSDPALQRQDSPVSPLPLVDSRPVTSDSAISTTPEETTPTRQTALASNPVRHIHTDSKSSAYSQHSKSSSSSSRLLGFTRDSQGRPQTISQQRANGGMTEDTRAAHSSTPNGASHEMYPETSASTSNKMFGKGVRQGDDLDEAKKKSLEVLIQSNETLHYTLTPATVMKDEETFVSSRNRTETQDMADFIRNTGPPMVESGRPMRSDPALVSSHDIVTAPAAPNGVSPIHQRYAPSGQTYQHYTESAGRSKNPLGQPRDPRPERSTSIRDLADYARSTGPVDDTQLPRALSPRSPVIPSASIPAARPNVPSATGTKRKNRVKLEPRDPRPSRRAEVSELIDFIREGPPRAPGDHRIDRRVAPFRTTMDSEDLNNIAPNSDSSTKYSETSTRDGRSGGHSVNSSTALLTNNRTTNGITNGTRALAMKQPAVTEDDGMPQRTRRRIKDPYAIDFSDDDDIEEPSESYVKPMGNEESLIDFLRNTAPPPGMATQPVLAARSANSVPSQPSSSMAKINGIRDNSPHLTQSGSKIDKYRPTQGTHASHIEKNRVKPRLEARDATAASRTETSDLAEYLRNSGPPPSAQSVPQPLILPNYEATGADKQNGLFRMFTNRRPNK